MLSKQFTYLLLSIIFLLLLLFGYNIYSNYKKTQAETNRITHIINKFEEKFKNDSIYLAKENKLLIDRVSQKIIDSISSEYEHRLTKLLEEKEKYKALLLANNISTSSFINPNKEPNKPLLATTNSNSKSSNVTTYSKLNKNSTNKTAPYSNNSNVTTYSKLNKNNSTNNTVLHSSNSNVTAYSKLNKNDIRKKPITKNNNTPQKFIKNSKLVNHNNQLLDYAENMNTIDFVPVFPNCENEIDKKNCFAIKISKHIIRNFNNSRVQGTGLKKGIHKVRVLFIIDKNGNAKLGKLVGTWTDDIYIKVKNSIESLPKMKPGIKHNKPTPVKYSLLIPFVI